eukprot:484026-Prorocentrum_minimum.AAC.2
METVRHVLAVTFAVRSAVSANVANYTVPYCTVPVARGLRVEAGGVEAEAIRQLSGAGALDGRAQAGHHRVDLLRQIVLQVRHNVPLHLFEVVGAVGDPLPRGHLRLALLGADDVRDGLARGHAVALARLLPAKRHLRDWSFRFS